MARNFLRIAIQKSGRLNDDSVELLKSSGLAMPRKHPRLSIRTAGFPAEIFFVRDDDIPRYVSEGICDLGIVGLNVLEEVSLANEGTAANILMPLGFSRCRLATAVRNDSPYETVEDLCGKRIATSYPKITGAYFAKKGISITTVEMGGSVEAAPSLGIADGICDLVSTGSTLAFNQLREVETILNSEAQLIATPKAVSAEIEGLINRLVIRFEGVIRAKNSKYIMMNAPASAIATIRDILPGMEHPTVLPLNGDGQSVAIHAVAPENIFWETIESLKEAGASSILVSPIEKVIE